MDDPLAREAREKWGDTESYRVAATRTAGYSTEDWQQARAEADEIAREFAGAMEKGADGTQVAERHRMHIDKWYYPCSSEMHMRLAEMYVSDPRFREYWDGYAPGLAEFVKRAIWINGGAGRNGTVG